MRVGQGQLGFDEVADHFARALRYLDDFSRRYKTSENAAGIQIFSARILNNLGLLYFQQGFYEQALDTFEESCSIKSRHHDDRGIAQTRSNMAKCLCETERLGLAAQQLSEVVSLMRKSPDVYVCKDAVSDLLPILGSLLDVPTDLAPHQIPFKKNEPFWSDLSFAARREEDAGSVLRAVLELNEILVELTPETGSSSF